MTWATISPPRSRRLARVPLRYLARLPVRVRDRHFWYVQILLVAVTAFHTFMELRLPSGRYHGLKEMAVILYLLPMAYASLLYGWEGTLLTGLGAAVLATPNIIFLHRGEFEWAAELVEVAVVVVAGTLLARQVEVEAKLRRAAEEATRRLALSEAEYKDLFENAADAILVFADDGTIVSANPASSTLTDFPPAELLGMPLDGLVGSGGVTRLFAGLAGAGGDLNPTQVGTQLRRLTLRRKDGSDIVVEAAATALPDETGALRVQAIVRDVTLPYQREVGLRSFLKQVSQAQEEERKRISRELHDETAQQLALVRRELEEVLRTCDDVNGEAHRRVERADLLAGEALAGVRRFSRALRPPMLDDLGLEPALDALVNELARRSTFIAELVVNGTPRRLASEAELALYRIVQEALRNAEKYARPQHVSVSLRFRKDLIRVVVEDDGCGFDTKAVLRSGLAEGHLGLLGMRERAGLLGAKLRIRSVPGRGTAVTVSLRTGSAAGVPGIEGSVATWREIPAGHPVSGPPQLPLHCGMAISGPSPS